MTQLRHFELCNKRPACKSCKGHLIRAAIDELSKLLSKHRTFGRLNPRPPPNYCFEKPFVESLRVYFLQPLAGVKGGPVTTHLCAQRSTGFDLLPHTKWLLDECKECREYEVRWSGPTSRWTRFRTNYPLSGAAIFIARLSRPYISTLPIILYIFANFTPHPRHVLSDLFPSHPFPIWHLSVYSTHFLLPSRSRSSVRLRCESGYSGFAASII